MICELHTLHNVQDQSRVLVGMEIDHITQWTVGDGGTKHRDVILEKKKPRKRKVFNYEIKKKSTLKAFFLNKGVHWSSVKSDSELAMYWTESCYVTYCL